MFLTAVLVLASCGQEKREPTLLDSMPAGYDLYLTFNPSEIDIDAVLSSMEDIAAGARQQMPWPVAGALGFDPFTWDGWVDALALSPGGEVGFVVGLDNDEPEVIALFLPSTDPDRIRGFVEAIASQVLGMDMIRLVTESEGYVVLAIAEEQSILDELETSLGTLVGTDEEFAELRAKSTAGIPAMEFFAKAGVFSREGEVETVMVSCFSEESSLGFQFLFRTYNMEAIESSAVIASEPNGGSAMIPDDVTGAMRVSMDMDAVKDMMADYMPPDAQMGIAMLGFESVNDMFDIFSGDAWLALHTDGDSYAGMIAYGLADKGAFQDLLERMSGMMAMSGEGFSTFQFQGRTCFRVDADIVEGIESIEIGIVDDAMVAVGGYTLQNVADGVTFNNFLEQTGLDVADDGGFAFAADLGALAVAYDLNRETGEIVDFEEFGYVAMSGASDRAIFQLSGSIDFGSGNPFAIMADCVAVIAIARMYEPFVEAAPIELPPVEEELITPPAEEPDQPDSIATEISTEPPDQG